MEEYYNIKNILKGKTKKQRRDCKNRTSQSSRHLALVYMLNWKKNPDTDIFASVYDLI